MNKTKITLIFVMMIGLFFGNINSQAQTTITEEDNDVIKINTDSVQTTLRASNSKGKPTLVKQSDIRILVDGVPQEASYFATNQIKKFIILLDSSASMRGRKYKRCLWFLNELAENSLDGQSFDVITFSEKTEYVGTFTKRQKKDVLSKLEKTVPDGDTALYDSVVETLQNFDRKPENAVLIVLTDGSDNISSAAKKAEADRLLAQFGTLTYLIVLHNRMAYRDVANAPNDDNAKNAVTDFQKILQPVAFIIKNEIEFNELADKLPREAGFLVKIGFEPDENLLAAGEIHKLEIIHKDTNLQLTYRQSFLMRKEN